MTTPAKSALDEARERLEFEYSIATEFIPGDEDYGEWRVVTIRCPDLRLVLDALKEAQERLEQFEECQLDSDGFCTDENCNRHD